MSEGITIKASRGEYKGRAVITLSSGANERYPFTFGLQKAKRILACIKDIEAFVAEEELKAKSKSAASVPQPAPAAAPAGTQTPVK